MSVIVMNSQNSSKILEEVNKYHKHNYDFNYYDLFTPLATNFALEEKISNSVSNFTLLEINEQTIRQIYQEKPLLIELSIPYNNSTINVELYKKNILTEEFSVIDQDKEKINYKSGVFYRGVVKNSSQSVVAFSFFNNKAYGVASSIELGNVNIGKLKDENEYISFADKDLKGENPFVCGFDDIEENVEKVSKQNYNNDSESLQMTNNCVRVYYEVAYEPYLQNNSSVEETIDWVTSIHNNISTLYDNDNIQVALSEVMVWTEQDPYVYGYQENLYYFSEYRTGFNGDLAHLINQPSTTSIAFINSLCNSNNYAYSAVSQYFAQVPTYSWSIMASTHEMGHALGSPHTHACAWNGNNTAIDGCGPAGGADEGCDGPIPPDGGTIMSYCHLVSTGINLSSGFGPQPGQLIRNTVDGKACLGTDCINSCFNSVENITFNNVNENSATINIQDAVSSEWRYKVYPYPGNTFLWQETTSNNFDIENLSSNTYYEVLVGNLCGNGLIGGELRRLLLTDGNYCGGETFTDTGSTSGNYGDNEYLVKTFYPSNDNEAITLDFIYFDLELDYDFMSIYDGTSVDAPVFDNGENLTGSINPESFTATNPEGAITVRFVSDAGVNEGGWEAEITCNSSLSANNFNKSSIKLYPNPANSYFNISSEEMISSITVYDLAGRRVVENQNIKQTQTQVNVQNLTTGAYFVKVNVNGATQTFKIIKE